MANRKRKRPGHSSQAFDQKVKPDLATTASKPLIKHQVLEQYYPQVLTLREHLLLKLPVESKIRRRKLSTAGLHGAEACNGSINAEDKLLRYALDTTLVGSPYTTKTKKQDDRSDKWLEHAASCETSDITFQGGTAGLSCFQAEIVDFVIWLLFAQSARAGTWPKHILCQGYRRGPQFTPQKSKLAEGDVNGLSNVYLNQYISMLKSAPWQSVLRILGKGGDLLMIDLLLDCGVFKHAESGRGNYYQISGPPLWELKAIENTLKPGPVSEEIPSAKIEHKASAAIAFVRSRILYGRAVLNSHGAVRFGFRHIHALNRYPSSRNATLDRPGVRDSSVVILAYIFPRQFGLHNVFTSAIDSRQTVQPFKDYMTREDELSARRRASKGDLKIPKRLRGKAVELVKILQLLHERCPYDSLINYYCPHVSQPAMQPTRHSQSEDSTMLRTQITQMATASGIENGTPMKPLVQPRPNVTDYATPAASVSAFCRAVLTHLLPKEFLGVGEDQKHNHTVLMNSVDRFLRLRRFESMTLHDVSQGLKISGIPWLLHEDLASKGCQSDTCKRIEIFNEFLYYVFDSLLIPLLRCNFHVTESGVHRYRIFFFRHDVWRKLAEPAMADIKASMFEEVETSTAHQILNSRKIGFSQLRLLPKEKGVRPITNLRRRPLNKSTKLLGRSINSLLTPVYNMLTFEKEQTPSNFGSTLFSVGDLYSKLKAFKRSLSGVAEKLFICKVDVQSAFDTIPQPAVLKLTSELARANRYQIAKHVEIKPAADRGLGIGRSRPKPSRKWVSTATGTKVEPFSVRMTSRLATQRKNTVFVDNVKVQSYDRADLLSLLNEHVQQNMIKIGKKYYRQKKGIPQGSVVSSLLCNYFYADLEAQHLSFLDPKSSLLLRLIDDFLLITTNPTHAKRFLQIMHDGVPEYGVTVNPTKTLVNFEVTINFHKLQRIVEGTSFPYCGAYIDTRTLNLSKNRDRRDDANIADSLTVEYSKVPGLTFQRKVLNTLKIQCHAMFIDTSLNSAHTVARNIYEIFIESATKMYAYNKCLGTRGPHARAGPKLVCRTIESLIELAYVLMISKGANPKNLGFRCSVTKGEVRWLCLKAFEKVLRRRQSGYTAVLEWLVRQLGEGRAMKGVVTRVVE